MMNRMNMNKPILNVKPVTVIKNSRNDKENKICKIELTRQKLCVMIEKTINDQTRQLINGGAISATVIIVKMQLAT